MPRRRAEPTAEDVIDLIARLSEDERRRFSDQLLQPFAEQLLDSYWEAAKPILENLVAELRGIWSGEVFRAEQDLDELKSRLDQATRAKVFLTAKLLRYLPGRRYKDRDAEIVRLRDEDKRRWSWKALGARFDITREAARKAYTRCKRRQNPPSSTAGPT
jgi:hypothetical protein